MRVLLLPGDGIGPEVTKQAVKVLTAVCSERSISLETSEALIGGAAIRATGSPLPEETIRAFESIDAVFLGAVGDPEMDHLPPDERPERSLLEMRKILGGFANLRPSRSYEPLIGSSPLRREVIDGTDILIVRELLGGLYFGEPRGFADGPIPAAFNTMRYDADEVRRVARIAFACARERRRKLTSVDKANVLETSQLWRKTVTEVAAEFPEVELEHLYVDACAMHLVTKPSSFDVILTENLFGDILSDEAAVLTGSLGTLPSATIGGSIDLFEPVHGSAPDIAGKGLANPIGAIASAAMLLRHTAGHEDAAAAVEIAIERAIAQGYRTPDIATGRQGERLVSTDDLGNEIARLAVERDAATVAAV